MNSFCMVLVLVSSKLIESNELTQNYNSSKTAFHDLIGLLNQKLEKFDYQFGRVRNLTSQIKETLENQNENVNKIKNEAKKHEAIDTGIIKFNIGGTYFSTLKSTLDKKIKKSNSNEYYDPHLLQALIAGMIKVNYDENKAIFIDRNPTYFNIILDYLRSLDSKKQFAPKNLKTEGINDIMKEAEYFELYGLVEILIKINFDSVIVKSIELHKILMRKFKINVKWKLLYRASVDGFTAYDFHSKCDTHSNTLTIIKTTDNYVFGGYTRALWADDYHYNQCRYKDDDDSFIFSLVNNLGKPEIFGIKDNTYAICASYNYGPTFGNGHDIYISDSSNTNTNSYSNLGRSYKNSLQNFYLAGTRNFRVAEIEVFKAKL
jgi:hypothetical protein